jgi:plasmid stabilization system protein ParE
MAEIVWTLEAQRWLEDIFDFIAADNVQAAAETVEGMRRTAWCFSRRRSESHAVDPRCSQE